MTTSQYPKQPTFQEVDRIYSSLVGLDFAIDRMYWPRSMADKYFRQVATIRKAINDISRAAFSASHETRDTPPEPERKLSISQEISEDDLPEILVDGMIDTLLGQLKKVGIDPWEFNVTAEVKLTISWEKAAEEWEP